MPNYALLQSKIQADHANDTPEQIRDALSAKTLPAYKNIDALDIKRYLVLADLWLAIKSSQVPACVITMDALAIFPFFQMDIQAIRDKLSAMMDLLIAANLTPAFTATHKLEILAMGDTLISWADQNWSGDVQLWQIAEVING